MSGLICAGDIFIDVLDDTMNPTGYLPPVNATRFVVAAKGAETKERQSRMRDSYGTVLDSVSKPNPHETAVDFDDLSGAILAMAFSGTTSTLAEGGVTAQAVEVTAKLGNWVEIGYRNVTTLVVKDATDTTTYVAGTDYELNARLGLVRAIPGGAISDAAVLHLTVTSGDVTGERVSGALRSQINVKMKLDGKNLATGEDITVIVPRATLNADNEVDFLSEDYAGVTLTGIVVKLDTESAPYYVDRPVFA
ncbi:hypothetical protein [Guyparkeria sp.]|uniref:phage tail tube protein n=1 Tax=Guyparkeria sp. TaxID=2035736 RepID=UPI0039708C19